MRGKTMIRFPRELFELLYGTEQSVLAAQECRYAALAEQWHKRYETDNKDADSAPLRFFSSPGRSEIGGNHTDHNFGKVLAASIRQDCIAAVRATDDNTVYVYDPGYNEDYSINIGGSETFVSNGTNTENSYCEEKDRPPLSAALCRDLKTRAIKRAALKPVLRAMSSPLRASVHPLRSKCSSALF